MDEREGFTFGRRDQRVEWMRLASWICIIPFLSSPLRALRSSVQPEQIVIMTETNGVNKTDTRLSY